MGKLLFIVEDEEKMAELGRELKQEKQKRKELDSKFSQIQEEFADMKSTNETLQKVWQLIKLILLFFSSICF